MTEDAGKKELEITVKPTDLTGEGFIPKYRQILSFMQAFTNVAKATPDDLDEAVNFLVEHIVEPEDEFEKRRLIDKLTAEQVVDLFEKIGGQTTAVPPTRSEVSVNSSRSSEEVQTQAPAFGRLS